MTNSHVPRSRLNEIALRKLTAWGVRATTADEQVTGELSIRPGMLSNPFDKQNITRAAFAVRGHDHLVFSTPPLLEALPPQSFYDFPTLDAFVVSLDATIRRRLMGIKQLSLKLKDLGYPAKMDAARGLLTLDVPLHASLGTLTLEGDERGMFAVRLTQQGGRVLTVGPESIPFAAFAARTAFELQLSKIAEAAIASTPKARSGSTHHASAETGDLELELLSVDLQSRRSDPAPPPSVEPLPQPLPPPPRAVRASDAPPGSLSLGLLVEKLGAGTLASAGLSLSRELTVGGVRARFELKHLSGLTFYGRLTTEAGTVWSDELDLQTFPSVESFVELMLGQE